MDCENSVVMRSRNCTGPSYPPAASGAGFGPWNYKGNFFPECTVVPYCECGSSKAVAHKVHLAHLAVARL